MNGVDIEFLSSVQQRSFAQASPRTAEAYPAERRMTGAQLAHFLARRRYLVIATTRPDGRPHAALTSFVWRDSSFWIPTEHGTARLRNLEQNPYAFLVITEGEGESHIAVLAEGSTRFVSPDGADAAVRHWSERFGGPPTWAGTWIVLQAQKLFSYAASAAAV